MENEGEGGYVDYFLKKDIVGIKLFSGESCSCWKDEAGAAV